MGFFIERIVAPLISVVLRDPTIVGEVDFFPYLSSLVVLFVLAIVRATSRGIVICVEHVLSTSRSPSMNEEADNGLLEPRTTILTVI